MYLHSLLTLQGGSTAASDPWGLSFMRCQSHQLNRYLYLASPSFLLPCMCLQVVVEEDTEMHHPLRQRQTQAAQLTHTKGRRFCLHLKRPKRTQGQTEGKQMPKPSHLLNFSLTSPLEEGPQAAHSHLRFLFGC